ncbi:MAG TPA: FAD-dependent oxidoreductase, partial [Acidimicrobiales bacterium]|nr:FAD-dependent oxidoreductase [Acidimicrobiales bacterium]
MHFVILGGGPAGTQAATYAARLGVEVSVVERDVIGGAADMWDCIPSKAMIATGGAMSFLNRSHGMGLAPVSPRLDMERLRQRISSITTRLGYTTEAILSSQDVQLLRGEGRMDGPHRVVAETADGPVELQGDAILLATGSRPRIPE